MFSASKSIVDASWDTYEVFFATSGPAELVVLVGLDVGHLPIKTEHAHACSYVCREYEVRVESVSHRVSRVSQER
jgi:hypothetical protein